MAETQIRGTRYTAKIASLTGAVVSPLILLLFIPVSQTSLLLAAFSSLLCLGWMAIPSLEPQDARTR